MLTKKTHAPVISLAGQAAQSADQALRSTQRAASDTLETVVEAAHEIHDDALTPLLNRAAEEAGALAARGATAVREGSRQARAAARQASERTVTYVRAEPVKAMLVAVATGAALLAVFNFVTRSRVREQ
jgi:ElaB/YqjD/DUF883 family membrane-anchored ribosome-binding protein